MHTVNKSFAATISRFSQFNLKAGSLAKLASLPELASLALLAISCEAKK